ncbi:hypothetical protein AB0L06_11805 [Spirillospora sp. NPDC052269]
MTRRVWPPGILPSNLWTTTGRAPTPAVAAPRADQRIVPVAALPHVGGQAVGRAVPAAPHGRPGEPPLQHLDAAHVSRALKAEFAQTAAELRHPV